MSAGVAGSSGWTALLPAATSAIGTGLKAYGQLSEGDAVALAARRKSQAAQFEADQLDTQASEELASSQIQRQLVVRQVKYTQSALIARAAASGAGASDPTVVNLVAKNAQEGAYREGVALYEGEAAARALRMRAMTSRMEAENLTTDAEAARSASRIGAISTLTSGISSLQSSMQKYWKAPHGSDMPTATGDY